MDQTSQRYKIGAMSRITGLKPELLRAWERRFDLFRPERTEGRQRLYTEDDLHLALYLARRTGQGDSIGALGRQGRKALLGQARRDHGNLRGAALELGAREGSLTSPQELVERVVAGAMATDAAAVREALVMGQRELDVDALLDTVVKPASRRIGDLWANGQLSVASEHLASAVLRDEMVILLRSLQPQDAAAAPEAVVACAPGEFHENPALGVAVHMANAGWRVGWLGAATPVMDLEAYLRVKRPHAVLVSVTQPACYADARADLLRLATRWRGGIELLVGGQGVPDGDPEFEAAHARVSREYVEPTRP